MIRFTLQSAANLDMADRIQRVIRFNGADLTVTAFCDLDRDGRQVWTAIPYLGYYDQDTGRSTDERGIRYDSFEIPLPRSRAARVVLRYLRDWANHREQGGVW